MPDSSHFEGVKIGPLSLDEFFLRLNRRITERFGREKQIGHSFFMIREKAMTDESAFADSIREDVLPLLQEYCLDDYELLATFLGDAVVDKQSHSVNFDILREPDALLDELVQTYATSEDVDAT